MKNAISGAAHAGPDMSSASDEVKGAIARIEAKRQAAEKLLGLAASGTLALRELHELLDRIVKALKANVAAGRPDNVDAVIVEIQRVTALTVFAAQGPSPGRYRGRRNALWQHANRSRARYVRRTTAGPQAGYSFPAKLH